jgi:hypothetical protein
LPLLQEFFYRFIKKDFSALAAGALRERACKNALPLAKA